MKQQLSQRRRFSYLIRTPVLCLVAFNGLPTIAQSSSIHPSLNELVAKSAVVVVGTVRGSAQVIRPDKLHPPPQVQPDGSIIAPTPDPEDYVLGRVVRFHVEEVLKRSWRRKIKKESVLEIFIPGYLPVEGGPVLAEKGRQLVFLTPMRVKPDDPAWLRAQVEDSEVSDKTKPFHPRSCFLVVENDKGIVLLTAENRQVIARVKAVLRRRHHASIQVRSADLGRSIELFQH